MKIKKFRHALLFCVTLVYSFYLEAQTNIIFDTDMGSDCDDAGALAVLHKLADKGEANILGVMFSSGKNKYGAGVCDAINTYYGRGDLPIGQYKGNDVGDPNNTYSRDIATGVTRYHHNIIDSAQELVAAYKTLLRKQPDNSVTIVTVGHPNGIYDLMQDKQGSGLIKRKVKSWVAMAYADILPKRDWNFGRNGAEDCIVQLLRDWPTPVYISWSGKKIITGNHKLPLSPEDNPVKQAYRLWKNTLVSGRPSPDQVAVLFAIRPQYFITDSHGSMQRNKNLETYWDPKIDVAKQARVIHKISDEAMCKIVEDLMTEPAASGSQVHIPDNISFGTPTRGGNDGVIVKVTNLNADGPGSLQEALQADGPRIVVFEVAGVIDLNKGRLSIRNSHITIAGQTAPSPGITIIRGGLDIKAHDVIIRHIRIRPGDAGAPKKSGWEPDGLTTVGGNAYNIIIDHCSLTWAVDENLSASGPRTSGPDSTSHKITFSNNIIAESLYDASHSKGIHSMGSLVHDFVQDIAIVGNLYSCNNQRNAFFKAFTKGVFANNIIYNPGNFAIQLFWSQKEWEKSSYTPENCRISIVGNIMYKGINSKKGMAMVSRQGDAYMEDNAAYEADGTAAPLTSGEINLLAQKPSWPDNFTALHSKQLTSYIAAHVGARPRDRDNIDTRIINDFQDRKARFINSQEEVGGYPKYAAVYRKLVIPENNIENWLNQLAAGIE